MKLDEERQSEIRSHISPGDSLVLVARVVSLLRSSWMSVMASLMGTDGKSAVASKDTIRSLGPSLSPLIRWTNSVEFLHTRGFFSIKGWRSSPRWVDKPSGFSLSSSPPLHPSLPYSVLLFLLSFHSLMMFCVISSKIRNKNIRFLSSLTTHSHKLRL